MVHDYHFWHPGFSKASLYSGGPLAYQQLLCTPKTLPSLSLSLSLSLLPGKFQDQGVYSF